MPQGMRQFVQIIFAKQHARNPCTHVHRTHFNRTRTMLLHSHTYDTHKRMLPARDSHAHDTTPAYAPVCDSQTRLCAIPVNARYPQTRCPHTNDIRYRPISAHAWYPHTHDIRTRMISAHAWYPHTHDIMIFITRLTPNRYERLRKLLSLIMINIFIKYFYTTYNWSK